MSGVKPPSHVRRTPISALHVSVFAVPLACGPWFLDVDIVKLVVAATAGACAVAALFFGGRALRLRSRIDMPLVVFGLVALLSTAISIDRDLSLFGDRQEMVFCLEGLAGCMVAFYCGCGQGFEARSGLINWAVAGSLPISLMTIAQAVTGQYFRARGSFGTPIFLGSYLALIAPLAIFLFSNPNGSRRSRVFGGCAFVALFLALALTGSRGAWIAALVGIVAEGASLWSPRMRRFIRPGVAVLVGGLLIFAALGFRSRAMASSRSDSLRMGIWKCALKSWRSHPWIGSGVGTFVIDYARLKGPVLAKMGPHEGYARNAHNDLLETLTTMGLLGLASFLWLQFTVIGAFIAAKKRNPTGAAALGAGILAIWVLAKFNPPGFAALWIMSAMAGCLFSAPSDEGERRKFPTAALICALAIFWFTTAVTIRARADHQDVLGRWARAVGRPQQAAEHFENAIRLRPGMVAYVNDLANLLWDAAQSAQSQDRSMLLTRAAEAAVQGLQYRPLDPQLYRLLALAEVRRAQSGDVTRFAYARRALEDAERLDPGFEDTMGLRRLIAPPTFN